MLTIRREQLDHLDRIGAERRIERIAEYLRIHHGEVLLRTTRQQLPIRDLDRELLKGLVLSSIRMAEGYGFSTESALLTFTVLRFVTSPDFDKHEAVFSVLTNADIPIDSRIDALWRYTSEEHWEDIENSYNSASWEADQA